MLKSNVANLREALSSCSQELYLSEVRYLDYEKEPMLDGNMLYPIIHKQSAYSYENEVRIIYMKNTDAGFNYDWSKEKVEDGVYINVDLDKLIDEIVLSPFSPLWFFELVSDICTKYGLKKKITRSKLAST